MARNCREKTEYLQNNQTSKRSGTPGTGKGEGKQDKGKGKGKNKSNGKGNHHGKKMKKGFLEMEEHEDT